MTSTNPFGLLGGDDSENPTQLFASKQLNAPAQAPALAKKAPVQAPAAKDKPAAKLPSKPVPPTQAVRESKNEYQHGGHGGGRGRRGLGFNRDHGNEIAFGNTNGFTRGIKISEDGDTGKDYSERRPYVGPRGDSGFRGGRRGGISNGETTEGERPRRVFDRHSGTGRGFGFKREGAGRGNWGTPADEIATETEEPVLKGEKIVDTEKPSEQDVDANKETPANEPEEKEPEEKEMTLEEYEMVLEEKRKPLAALKSEERKVNLDKELEAMRLLSNKKNDDELYVKLGYDKDKRKDAAEKAKKSVSIIEFLKPAKGEYPRSGGRGQGRGRCGAGISNYNVQAPAIENVGEFPSLAGPWETVQSTPEI